MPFDPLVSGILIGYALCWVIENNITAGDTDEERKSERSLPQSKRQKSPR